MSIVFIGTPEFAVPSLRALAAGGYDISAVITQPDREGSRRKLTPPAVKAAAEALGLPVLQPETLRDPAVVDQLRALEPEVIVLAAYGQILRQNLLDIPPRGVLNVHASLLPKLRGASPIAGAILAGVEETGVTIMLMDAGMDTGAILSQRAIPIDPEDTTGTLTEKLAGLGAELLIDTLPRWLAGEITPRPQDDSQASVTRLIRKPDGAIDWSLPAVEIWRRVRAYNPWPGAQTTLDGETVTIWEAWPLSYSTASTPGQLFLLPREELVKVRALNQRADRLAGVGVQTGDGVLALVELQRQGRKRLDAGTFVRGIHNLDSARFESP